jgi:hypothetical protein
VNCEEWAAKNGLRGSVGPQGAVLSPLIDRCAVRWRPHAASPRPVFSSPRCGMCDRPSTRVLTDLPIAFTSPFPDITGPLQ